MSDAPSPASMIDAAQRAVSAGDYLAAERLLREAASIQEATLGSLHPELASTLNNLAFVCERTNNIAEAERGYRRAHAIAVASLGPRDPFVATSIQNLVGFCAAHGIPIWRPPSVQPDTEVAIPDTESPQETPLEQAPVVVRQRRMRPLAIAATALAIVLVAAIVFNVRRAPQPSSPTSAAVLSPPASSPVRPAPAPFAPAPAPAPAREVQQAVATNVRPQPTVATQSVTVLDAQLCKTLARRGAPDWQCTSAGTDLQPGTVYFYTRLLTDMNTTVEHRWYRGDRVHQVMKLHVAANSGGYRTYSSNTVSAERAGDWKVELRAVDGTVLHKQSFVIHLP